MGGRQIKQEKITVINADDLTWLARNVHEWNFFIDSIASVSNGKVTWLDPNIHSKTDGITRAQWLARRAELQNKPSWKDAPETANYMAQEPHGIWTFFVDQPLEPSKFHNDGWRFDGFQAWCSECRGEVLSDWRDTLERRPEPDIKVSSASCPACGSKGIHACLGSKSSNESDWFERGELPPVGTVCETYIDDASQWFETEIVAHRDGFAIGWCKSVMKGCHGHKASEFRPLRSEREKAIDEMMIDSGALQCETTESIMLNLYDAGYRKS